MIKVPLPTSLLKAIAMEEGFFDSDTKEPNRPQRNHNPGDLLWCDESARFGAVRGDPHFAIFPDEQTGWYALREWLSVPAKFDRKGNLDAGYLGATLKQVIFRFAPPAENNSAEYLINVCKWTGLTPETVVTQRLLTI